MIAAHHAEAARFEAVMAALRGETGEAIGAAFAEAMSKRPRYDLPGLTPETVQTGVTEVVAPWVPFPDTSLPPLSTTPEAEA